MFSYLKYECRMKKGPAPDKSFRKTFGEKKKINSDESKFSKNFKSQPNWQSTVSPDRRNKLSPVRSAYEAKPN